MPAPPPRPASRMGGPPSPGSTGSASGTRPKETDKQQGTFFLGRYRVVDEIGVGGMASVHLARMDGPGGFQKWVAIKRIHPHLVEDDQFVDMFLDEARIAAGINHANVAQVFDLGKDDNTYWIAMEYLHGEPLREVMRRSEEHRFRISPELASRICADAAKGLHAAHELKSKSGQLLGLVHRDVTPHNLFLTYDGYTKVVDFGIAKVADRLSSTRAGTLKGKLAYMSPEQVRGAEVDRTTDIFALGVVLWELTTNQRLFRMDTDLDTLEKVQACVVPPPSTLVQDYPPELETVVLKALAKRKQDRFQTASEFSRALEGFLMRRGAFVGQEEVSQFVKQIFTDRIQKREAHLAWAAEVTSTINVDQLRGGAAAADDSSRLDAEADGKRSRSSMQNASASGVAPVRPPAPPPAAPEQQMAATSLMDDDEDVPTTVANREQMPDVRPSATALERPAPRPAAGAPAQMHAPSALPQVMLGAGPAQVAPPHNSYPQHPGGAAFPPAQVPMPTNRRDERTVAFPNAPEDDLGATVALPSTLQQGPQPQRPGFGPPMTAPQPVAYPNPGYNPTYPGQPYGQQHAQTPLNAVPVGFSPYPQQQPQQQQPQQQQLAPTQAFPASPMHFPPGQAQSQIETALSLPRPDPAALWLAQQDAAQRGQRRNTGVIIAIVTLTALCLIFLGALIYFKTRSSPAPITPSVSADTTAAPTEAAPIESTAPTSEASTAPSETASAAPSESPKTPPPSTAAAPATPATAPKSTGGTPPAAASSTAEAKEEPGFLTIVCNPVCDDVLDNGRSLGPSPIVHVAASPGQHRITLKKGSDKKVISVIVVSGQVTAQRVSMK